MLTKVTAALFVVFASAAALAQSAPVIDFSNTANLNNGTVQANEGDYIVLDASASYDPNTPPSPITYTWQQIAGPAANLSCASPTCSQFAVIVPYVGGTGGILTFQLTENNGYNLPASSTINVQIKVADRPPVVNIAQPTQPYLEGSTITIDASGTYDPDGDQITFQWSEALGPAVTLNTTNPAQPTFVAPVTGTPTTYRFNVLVSDGQQQVSGSIVLQTVPAHHAPIANAGVTETAGYGDTVTLDGTGSYDPDGNLITYTWTQTAGPIVILNYADPSKPTFVAPSKTATLTFSLTVQDQYLVSAPATVNINVYPQNAIPNCANAHANKTQIWPPNQTFARVKIRGLETDPKVRCDDQSGDDGEGNADADDDNEDGYRNIVRVTTITQDEPTAGAFKGDLSPDAIVQSTRPTGKQRVRDLIMVRREMIPNGNGRVYKINFTVTNSLSGLSCNGSVSVCVPTKRGVKGTCTDDGQKYNSFQK